jgi:hypothetical protein
MQSDTGGSSGIAARRPLGVGDRRGPHGDEVGAENAVDPHAGLCSNPAVILASICVYRVREVDK